MSIERDRLTIAIQKNGRLNEDTVSLFKRCDIDVAQDGRREFGYSKNFPLKVLFTRSIDIPRLLERGAADLGIVGMDVVGEAESPPYEALPLGFGQCKLALGVRKDFPYERVEDLANQTIATTYTRQTRRFFQFYGVPVDIFTLGGSVELAANQDWAKACVDIVSSGDSMRMNDLEVKEILMDSEAELVVGPSLGKRPETRDLTEDLLRRILGTMRAAENRYLAINAPASSADAIAKIVPGAESPTITPCADPNWVDIQTIVPASGFWPVVREIQRFGGRDLVELSLIRSIPDSDDPLIMRILNKIYGHPRCTD